MTSTTAVLLLFGCAILTSCSPTGGKPLTLQDLGSVEPGQILDINLEIQNNFGDPALLTGLDDSCGVSVQNAHNGILKPYEKLTLHCNARAARMAGPGGFKLDIGLAAGSKQSHHFYLYTYTVRGHPYLETTQAWSDSPNDTVSCLGVDARQAVTVSAEEGVEYFVTGHSIKFKLSSPLPPYAHRNAVVTAPDEEGRDRKMNVEVLQGGSAGGTRIYPSYVWIDTQHVTLKLANAPADARFRISPPVLTATRKDASLELVLKDSAYRGSFVLEVLDDNGRRHCSLGGFISAN